MPKGTPLTPEQITAIGEHYVITGNASETARRLNLSFETVRDALARTSNARRRQLQEQAIDDGLDRGVERLVRIVDKVAKSFEEELDAGKVEPTHQRDLMNAVARGMGALVQVKAHGTKQKLARLTRKRTQLEIDELAAEAAKRGRGGATRIFKPGDPEWADLQREVFGSARQGMTHGPHATRRDPADVAARDVPAVPAPVDSRRR